MVADAVPQRLTTVVCSDEDQIHLAVETMPTELMTLCGQPIDCRVSARTFHRLGCPQCAQAAVDSGVTSFADHQGATVNLPRFLAARRRPDPSPSSR